MHFKYLIISIIITLIRAKISYAEEKPVFDAEQLVKSIEERNDKTSDLIRINPNYNLNKYPVDNIGKNPVSLNLKKDTGNVATDKGVDAGKLLSKYQPEFKAEIDKPKKLNQLLIFISLSMPKESLIALNGQAQKAGGLLILRGLVNNSFKETANVLHNLSTDSINVIVDPRLYEVFAVKSVPTFVVLPTDTHPCGDKKCKFTPMHDRIAGNITLEYALEQISLRGKLSNIVASNYLKKLRKNHD